VADRDTTAVAVVAVGVDKVRIIAAIKEQLRVARVAAVRRTRRLDLKVTFPIQIVVGTADRAGRCGQVEGGPGHRRYGCGILVTQGPFEGPELNAAEQI
jgi:hypothetical protein